MVIHSIFMMFVKGGVNLVKVTVGNMSNIIYIIFRTPIWRNRGSFLFDFLKNLWYNNYTIKK